MRRLVTVLLLASCCARSQATELAPASFAVPAPGGAEDVATDPWQVFGNRHVTYMDNFATARPVGISVQHDGPDGATVSIVARGSRCAGRHEVTAEVLEGAAWTIGFQSCRSLDVMAAILRQVDNISRICGTSFSLPEPERRNFAGAFAALDSVTR